MGKRTYDQYCGLARALEIVGERWTLLIVRDLALGPQRYSDLAAGLAGIASGLLAERLRALEAEGIVRKAMLPAPARVPVYELTPDGEELAKAILPLGAWGSRRLGPRDDQVFRADWLLFSLRAAFDPTAAVGVDDVYELHVGDEIVSVTVRNGEMLVRRGPSPVPADLVVRTDIETLIDFGVGDLEPADAISSGRASVDGTPAALERCARVFGAARLAPL